MPREKRVGPPKVHVVETEVGDEISLYDPETDQVMVLNTTASDIWRLSDGEHTTTEIVALLANAYQVEADQIGDEVAATIGQFIDNGFIDEAEAG
jgi:hypothetical protein